MELTGNDVWNAIVKLGLMRGPYDPQRNSSCANAERIAILLNKTLAERRGSFFPDLAATEDAIRAWEADTPREYVLRLYKTLNLLGYTVIGIDAAIDREAKKKQSVGS